MKRIALAVVALAAPLFAQDTPPANRAENLFYKAFYLEKGERRFDDAVELYQQFLAQAPDHRFARTAARQTLQLLQRTGKGKDAEAFAAKYEGVLGRAAVAAAGQPGDQAAGGAAGAGREGRGGRGQRGGGAGGQTPEQRAERLAQLKAGLASAKEEGDEEAVARLERQIQRMESGGGRGQGGRGQGGGRFGRAQVKFADMSAEEMEQFVGRLDRMEGFIDRIRESGNEERAKQMEEGIAAVRKALGEKKLDDAQKAWDKLMSGMRRRR